MIRLTNVNGKPLLIQPHHISMVTVYTPGPPREGEVQYEEVIKHGKSLLHTVSGLTYIVREEVDEIDTILKLGNINPEERGY